MSRRTDPERRVASLFEKVSPEPSEPHDVREVRGLVRFDVRDQIGQQQADGDLTSKTIRQVLRFCGRNDGVVDAVKQEDRDQWLWRS